MLVSILNLLAINSLVFGTPTPTTATLQALKTTPPVIATVSAYPVKKTTSLGPIISAKSALSIDLETGKILYAKNSQAELPMASLTKLMTVLVILKEHQLDEIVTVDPRAIDIEPSKMYLVAGEKIAVNDLIKAMIIKSANDAALALAYFDSNELSEFVDKMNQQAQSLGLTHTHFINPDGLDEPGHYSTTQDLAILARAVYRYPSVRNFAQQTSDTVTSIDGKITHELIATNNLLNSYLKVLGLKTGTTDLAGQCLITIVVSPTGQPILNLLLNSPFRFDETKIISQWIFDNYQWI